MAVKKKVPKPQPKVATADEYVGELRTIPLAKLQEANKNLPKPDPTELNDLCESIEEIGVLLQPIVVAPNFQIIAGRKRFAAICKLDWDEVPVNIVPLDGLKAKLAELDENLRRRQYTKLEFAELCEARMRLVLQLHPELAQTPQASGKRGAEIRKAKAEHAPLPPKVESITQRIATALSRSERTVQRDLARSSKIAKAVWDLIANTDLANNGAYLDKLGSLDRDAQIEAVGDGKGDIKLRIDRAIAAQRMIESTKKGGKPKKTYLTLKQVSMRLTEEATEIIASVHPKDLDGVVNEYESILDFVKQQVEARRPEEEADLAAEF